MEQQQVNKLNQLFNQFAQETQASSFAVENLLNKTIKILNSNKKDPKISENSNNE